MNQTQDPLVLDRLLEPIGRIPTPEVARRLVALRAEPEVQERLDLLADRCTEGTLTQDEQHEYDIYLKYVSFIGILQAKARRRLADEARS